MEIAVALPENSEVALLSVAVLVSTVPAGSVPPGSEESGMVNVKALALVSAPWLKPLILPE